MLSLFKIIIILLPFLSGIIVISMMNHYSKSEKSPRNVSPSYFASVALIFALFSSLVFSEVWGRISKINSLLLEQAEGLRGLLRISETIPNAAEPFHKAVEDYKRSIIDTELGASTGNSLSNETFMHLYQLASDTAITKKYFNQQAILLTKLDQVRRAWFERNELIKQRILSEKIIILFLMGFFTQIAIALSHLGNEKATRDTVLLFSISFSIALLLLTIIDQTNFGDHFIPLSALRDVY